jgi:hypothetical protein
VSYSNVTLLSEIQWEYLSLELSLDLTSPTSLLEMISPAFPPHTYTSSSASKNYSESLTISLAVRNVTLMLDAILAMDAQVQLPSRVISSMMLYVYVCMYVCMNE